MMKMAKVSQCKTNIQASRLSISDAVEVAPSEDGYSLMLESTNT
jgi:hypothetical protein